jgi:uncharacterized protein YfcZ (UPF0381/DUF406 family)
MKITVSYFDKEENEKEIKAKIDISAYFNGIGHYEYWGRTGYDKGDLCVDVNTIVYDKKDLTAEEIQQIEDYFESQEFHEEILQKHLDKQQAEREDAAEAAYEARKEADFSY